MRRVASARLTVGRAFGPTALLLLAVAAAATAPTPRAATSVPARPTPERAWLARVVAPTWARGQPTEHARRVMLLRTSARWNGGPEQLLVLGSAHDTRGRLWLHVRLPTRPNGSSGWVDDGHVVLTATEWRIVVRLGARSLSLYHADRLVRQVKVVVGAPRSPTPTGLFAVAERVAQPDPAGFLGPWALHLTAYSDVLQNYGGGPGTIGIHGRGGASYRDRLGSARSHGCIRVDNDVIRLLAHVAREGTPVRVSS